MVETSDFPQADRILQVGLVAKAVHKKLQTDEDIERFIRLDSGARQGRYYRHAAEILGLISNANNRSILTPLGKEYISLINRSSQLEFLARCIVDSPVFQIALQYIQSNQPDEEQLRAWFMNFYPGEESTARRRFSTFFKYLVDTNLIAQTTQSRLFVTKFHGAIARKGFRVVDGMRGTPVDPDEIRQYTRKTINNAYEINQTAIERANQTHWLLVSGKSGFLRERGFSADQNQRIDLFSDGPGGKIIYEMKSINGLNLISQTRKAVAQLYEYRYIFSAPAARLCIVTDERLAGEHQWLANYLAKDRCIAYVWTEDFVEFKCSKDSHLILEEFSPYQ